MNAEDKAQKSEKSWPKSSARKIIQQRANFQKTLESSLCKSNVYKKNQNMSSVLLNLISDTSD